MAAIHSDRRGEDELWAMPREPARFEQVAGRVEIDLGAELEVLLGAAGNQGSEMEYDADLRCHERAGELRIRDVADHCALKWHARLIGGDDICGAKRAHQCGTDVACRSGDQYSHAAAILIRRR